MPINLDEIEKVGNVEWTAWSLQGALFHDPELEWCRVVGWGMECGIIIIHYSPIDKVGSIGEEHLLRWIKFVKLRKKIKLKL